MIRFIKISVLAACWFGCTKSAGDMNPHPEITNHDYDSLAGVLGYQSYIIDSGEHFCHPNNLEVTLKNEFLFKVIFDSSAIYQTIDPQNQADINKLYGFSDCNAQHLVNSARIGWRWYQNELQLLAFVHRNGVMQPGLFIKSIAIGSVINCRITCLPDTYQFEVNGVEVEAPRACSERAAAYRLYPYFGGDETAPHSVKVMIDEF